MVVLEREACVECGLCARICHESCIEMVDDHPRIDEALCSTCTQCIAVCPQGALSWDGIASLPNDDARLPTPEQLDELFKQRRTMRHFEQDRPIGRDLIQEIASYGIYAPTNNYALRVIGVDDAAILTEFEGVIQRFVGIIYRMLYKPALMFRLLRLITPGMTATDKVKMAESIARGAVTELPAVAILIVGDARVALSRDSAQYALYNMILYAQTRGIGTRLKGTGPIFLDRSPRVRRRLSLGRHEHILGMVEMGYPAVRFAQKVMGKTLPMQWNEGNGSTG